ncbi:MAG TPA: stage II sporulation protein M [Firmicutes bacterium]|nr:stage II sporulation protein M [Bacillota bacterium]
MKRITLRPAVEKDAPKIQEIQQSILESHNNVDSIAAIRETMGKKGNHYFFITQGKAVVGFLSVQKISKDQCRLGPIFMESPQRENDVIAAAEIKFPSRHYRLETFFLSEEHTKSIMAMGYEPRRNDNDREDVASPTIAIFEKGQSQRNLFKEQLRKEKQFLPQLVKPVIFTALFFLFAMVLSFAWLSNHQEVQNYFNAMMETVVEEAESYQTSDEPTTTTGSEDENSNNEPLAGYDSFDMFRFIFLNNLRANGLIAFSGLLPFIFMPLFYLLVNCFAIGAFCITFLEQGIGLGLLLAGLLPHGIVEIPTMIVAASLGVSLCIQLIRRIIHETPILPMLADTIRTYLLLILPLVLIAALIEAYITPYAILLFM